MLLQGTLGGDFDIFAASGESTAWVLLWKTRSRPIGVRVCPVAQFNFFSTAFDPREWTMVVFWKEDSGRQPRLITPENEGGDETKLSITTKIYFSLMTLMFLLVRHWVTSKPPDPPGLPPGWPPSSLHLLVERESRKCIA